MKRIAPPISRLAQRILADLLLVLFGVAVLAIAVEYSLYRGWLE